MSLEDTDGQFDRWWRFLKDNKDWNSLTRETRKRLLFILKRCVLDLTNLDISEKDMLPLIKATDVLTVFDAILTVWALPDKDKKSRRAVLAYLKRVIINSWKDKRIYTPEWYKEPKRKAKGTLATLEIAERYKPYNFLKYCSVCESRLRSTNVTGVCASCQRRGKQHGNGTESEHNDQNTG